MKCVSCGATEKLALVLAHSAGSREWTKHRFLCQPCRDDPGTKGWWKYPWKPIQKSWRPKNICTVCKHDVKWARPWGCMKPLTSPLGRGQRPCNCEACNIPTYPVEK